MIGLVLVILCCIMALGSLAHGALLGCLAWMVAAVAITCIGLER